MVKLIIQRYTREAGVRNLERNLAALARAAAVKIAEQKDCVVQLSKDVHPMTTSLLDTRLADGSDIEMEVIPMSINRQDISNAFASPLTLAVDEAMLEKVLGVRARAADLKLSAASEINLLENRDIHIHFPAGAVPKDGPSAGVTLVTSLVSLFSQKKVRADTAMTGEMTLRGLVLPVGGIKDKVLAAHRYGIRRVILPARNLKDLAEVPSAILAGMEILLVKRIEDVLEQAFEGGFWWLIFVFLGLNKRTKKRKESYHDSHTLPSPPAFALRCLHTTLGTESPTSPRRQPRRREDALVHPKVPGKLKYQGNRVQGSFCFSSALNSSSYFVLSWLSQLHASAASAAKSSPTPVAAQEEVPCSSSASGEEEEASPWSRSPGPTLSLTHSDLTSKLTLANSRTINRAQGWYNRLQRDEVVAEWKKVQGEMSLHVHCHISGGHFLLDLVAGLRYYIFCEELPVVPKAFVHGEFDDYPEPEEAMVWVYFHSNLPEFNRVECWGLLRHAASAGRSKPGEAQPPFPMDRPRRTDETWNRCSLARRGQVILIRFHFPRLCLFPTSRFILGGGRCCDLFTPHPPPHPHPHPHPIGFVFSSLPSSSARSPPSPVMADPNCDLNSPLLHERAPEVSLDVNGFIDRGSEAATTAPENAFEFLGVPPLALPLMSPVDPFRNHTPTIAGLYEWCKTILCLPIAAVRLVLFGIVIAVGYLATVAALCGWKDKQRPLPRWRCRVMWITRLCARCILFSFG
ncbi:hypothetical protein BHM03_00022677 [Ensete ventricosum]|nr:hypothetical protein BHM03_00022677 [Ensete ventricosum]